MYTMAHRLLHSGVKTSCRSFVAMKAEMGAEPPETIAAIVAAHRAGTMTPAQTVARTYQRIRDHNDPAVFISLRVEKDAIAEAERLTARADAANLPLYGVPVAV